MRIKWLESPDQTLSAIGEDLLSGEDADTVGERVGASLDGSFTYTNKSGDQTLVTRTVEAVDGPLMEAAATVIVSGVHSGISLARDRATDFLREKNVPVVIIDELHELLSVGGAQ